MTDKQWTEPDLSQLQSTANSPTGTAGWQVGDSLMGCYHVEAIKSGAMGVVYLCGGTAGENAIKMILADPLADEGARVQMKAEAQAWLTLGPHPNVVPCELVLESPYDKRLFLFLERVHGHPVRGTSLGEWMRSGPLNAPTTAHVAAGIAEGMRFAWETASLVHRDLKPDNVLMTADGTPRVSDFGLARRLSSGTEGMGVAGTPAYMSPEAWRGGGHISVASDVYAFGVILWELLAREHPFSEHFDSAVSLRYAHAAVPPYDPRTLNPAAPETLARVALLCLAKEPSQRPADFAAVLRELGRDPQPFSRTGSIASEAGRAQGLMNMGRWSEAETIVEALRAANGDVLIVDLLRLRVLEETDRLSEDHALLEKMAALDATDGVTRRARQRALTLLGRHQQALAVVEEALVHESAGDLLHAKGQLLWTLERHDEALIALAEAKRFPALVDRARLLVALKRDDEAFECLMAALKMNPNDEETLVAISIELNEKGRDADALSYALKALHVSPGFRPARRMRARLMGRLGQRIEAEAELRALLAEDPEDVELWADLMRLLRNDAREGQIEECGMHIARGRARTARGHLLKGSFTAMLGDHQDAIISYDRALAADPAFALAWDLKGDAFMALRDPEQAVVAYRNAIALSPGDDKMAAHLSAALEQLQSQPTEPTASTETASHARVEGAWISAAYGCGRLDGGAELLADGVLVDPDLQAYAVVDGIGEKLPGSVFQPALNEMSGSFHAALGHDEVGWPFGVDPQLSFEGNVLRTALRIGNETLVSERPGPGFAVAAALLRGKVVEVASAGEALCLLVRDGHLHRLGVESILEFEIRAYQLEPGDLVVLTSHWCVEPIVIEACAPPGTPETAAKLLAMATDTRVVVIRQG